MRMLHTLRTSRGGRREGVNGDSQLRSRHAGGNWRLRKSPGTLTRLVVGGRSR